jgi:imidazoleglycerol phosphate synthase glutamine amidotransferase subunit HisH
MGWNDVPCTNPLFEGLEKVLYFIFYIPIILNAMIRLISWQLLSTAVNLLVPIMRMYGIQFHPEKVIIMEKPYYIILQNYNYT